MLSTRKRSQYWQAELPDKLNEFTSTSVSEEESAYETAEAKRPEKQSKPHEKIAIIDFDGTCAFTSDGAVVINPHLLAALEAGGYTGVYICTARQISTIYRSIIQYSLYKDNHFSVMSEMVHILKETFPHMSFYGVCTPDDITAGLPIGSVHSKITGILETAFLSQLQAAPKSSEEVAKIKHEFTPFEEVYGYHTLIEQDQDAVALVRSVIKNDKPFKECWIEFVDHCRARSDAFYQEGIFSPHHKDEQLRRIFDNHKEPHTEFAFFDDIRSILEHAKHFLDMPDLRLRLFHAQQYEDGVLEEVKEEVEEVEVLTPETLLTSMKQGLFFAREENETTAQVKIDFSCT